MFSSVGDEEAKQQLTCGSSIGDGVCVLGQSSDEVGQAEEADDGGCETHCSTVWRKSAK